ncbi:MAG: hypothetical protein JST27_09465 [Bacteroidetes bacterium]|nr:hypothetical protein [Bacteroidota bacterium]
MRQITFFPALIALAGFSNFTADAQDKIFFKDGTVLEARIREINNRDVVYTPWNSNDSSEYAVTKRGIQRVVFQNGLEQSFDNRRTVRTLAPRSSKTSGQNNQEDYGKNLICFSPLQMTNESAAGIGLQYERVLDKNGHISFSLPFALSFRQQEEYNPNGNYEQHSTLFSYIYPGLKFYPASYNHRVTYSIGPSFGFGYGKIPVLVQIWDPNGGYYRNSWEDKTVTKGGFMITNGLNIQITRAFYLGIEAGLGIFYFNDGVDHFSFGDDDPMAQLSFRMGYRF